MVLKTQISDREYQKFVEIDGKHVVQVTPLQSFSPPPETDAISTSYPDLVTEIYQYRQGGLSGTILKTVTIIYVDATKENLLSVEVA